MIKLPAVRRTWHNFIMYTQTEPCFNIIHFGMHLRYSIAWHLIQQGIVLVKSEPAFYLEPKRLER